MDIEINPDTQRATIRKPADDGGVSTWDVAPDQIEQHLRGRERPEHPWRELRAGEASALRDAQADAARRRRQDERNR